MKVYKPSGKMGPLALPAALVGGGAVAVAGAWLYQWLIDIIPFIYVNALLTVGFGAALGYVLYHTFRRFHGRSPGLMGGVGVVVALMGIGASFFFAHRLWQDDVREELAETSFEDEEGNVVSLADLPQESLDELLTFSQFIESRVELGWTLGKSGGLGVSGFMVYILWLIEGGIILAGTFIGAYGVAWVPFCERCKVWMPAQPLGVLDRVNERQARDVARRGAVEDLFALDKGRAHVTFTLSRCDDPTCPQWMSSDVHWTEGRGSKSESKQAVVVRSVAITDEQVEAIVHQIEARKVEPPTASAS